MYQFYPRPGMQDLPAVDAAGRVRKSGELQLSAARTRLCENPGGHGSSDISSGPWDASIPGTSCGRVCVFRHYPTPETNPEARADLEDPAIGFVAWNCEWDFPVRQSIHAPAAVYVSGGRTIKSMPEVKV